jgi:hypothetical protein
MDELDTGLEEPWQVELRAPTPEVVECHELPLRLTVSKGDAEVGADESGAPRYEDAAMVAVRSAQCFLL